jgi:hypothetical protein
LFRVPETGFSVSVTQKQLAEEHFGEHQTYILDPPETCGATYTSSWTLLIHVIKCAARKLWKEACTSTEVYFHPFSDVLLQKQRHRRAHCVLGGSEFDRWSKPS